MASTSSYPPRTMQVGPLELRRTEPADAQALADAIAASLGHLRPWMPWASEESCTVERQQERGQECLQSWEGGSEFIYTCYFSQTRDFVGSFGLHRRVGPGAIELGYWLHAARSGNGYATRVVTALTEMALELPDVDRVEIHCDGANVRSSAIPRRLGYRLDRIEDREPVAPAESGTLMIWATP